MSAPYLLIDGYNLLHAAGMARKRYAVRQLERARRQLLMHLAGHLHPEERVRTTVVFDAADAPPDVSRQMIVAEMTVAFATPGGDADALIEQLLLAHSAPRSVRVVSSDHRLQKAARRRRADFVDSETFVAELEHRGPVAGRDDAGPAAASTLDPKFGGAGSARDTERWLEVFGDIPEAAGLQDEVERQGGAWAEDLRKELEADLNSEGAGPEKPP